jgi:hypothetical protein
MTINRSILLEGKRGRRGKEGDPPSCSSRRFESLSQDMYVSDSRRAALSQLSSSTGRLRSTYRKKKK